MSQRPGGTLQQQKDLRCKGERKHGGRIHANQEELRNASRWRSVVGIAIELSGMSPGEVAPPYGFLDHVERSICIGISLYSSQWTFVPLICVNIVTIGAMRSVLFFKQEVL